MKWQEPNGLSRAGLLRSSIPALVKATHWYLGGRGTRREGNSAGREQMRL